MMEIFEYLTGKDGMIILGFIVLVIFIIRKWKAKRYFKNIEKRINDKNK